MGGGLREDGIARKKRERTDPILTMYVVTKNPIDFPGKIVVRRHDVFDGLVAVEDDPFIVHTHLPSVQRQLKMTHNLYRLPRDPNDDPVILEVWV